MTRRAVAILRDLVARCPVGAALPQAMLAASLWTLGIRLDERGRPVEALAAMEEAVGDLPEAGRRPARRFPLPEFPGDPEQQHL